MRRVLTIGGDLETLAARLHEAGYEVMGASTAEAGLQQQEVGGAELVLVNLPLADKGGAATLLALRRQTPRAILVATGSDPTIGGVADALRHGANEYIARIPMEGPHLALAIEKALLAGSAEAQLRYLRHKDAAGADWQTIVGESPGMRRVFATVRRLCERTTGNLGPPVLLQGETGTGKGLVAKALHYNGARRGRAFVDINCAALPASLIESELFGHTRGAFTDAHAPRAGLFETADKGTLFLDEVGALPLDLQAKLLKVIEERRVRRVGASQDIAVDTQILAATHRDIPTMVRTGEFREDLYHRLNVVSIVLPPLRERGDDAVLLAESFLHALCREYGVARKTLSAAARTAIAAHPWPGNVRELRNRIERVVLLEDTPVLEPEHLETGGAHKLRLRRDGERLVVTLPEESCPLDELERTVIAQALAMHEGNVSRTARYLRVTRYALMYRLRKHGLR